MKIRKNARWLTADERAAFLKAIVSLKVRKLSKQQKTMRLYDFYPLEHRLVRRRHRAQTGEALPVSQRDGGHGGPAFGSWHREWLRRFELDLQTIDSSVTLPYWDLTDRQGTTDVIFEDDFMGPSGSSTDGKITSGYFQENVPEKERPDWWPNEDDGSPLGGFMVMQGLTTIESRTMTEHATEAGLSLFNTTCITREIQSLSRLPTRDDIRDLMSIGVFFDRPAFDTFSMQWERQGYHGPGHVFVGGLMGQPPTSPNDPVFFLHHCGVDMIWALWQKRHDQSDASHLPPARRPNGDPVTRMGHHLEDAMWPWDGTLATNPNKAMPPPQQPFPPPDPDMRPPVFPDDAFSRNVDSSDIVRVVDLIDHHNLPDDTSYSYDVEIPFELETSGKTLAWIDPYFGDLSLTGNVMENTTETPQDGDLCWDQEGSTRGWVSSSKGDLHIRGRLIEDESDFSDGVLNDAIAIRHYNQPLVYLDQCGNFHLKGKLLRNQPPVA